MHQARTTLGSYFLLCLALLSFISLKVMIEDPTAVVTEAIPAFDNLELTITQVTYNPASRDISVEFNITAYQTLQITTSHTALLYGSAHASSGELGLFPLMHQPAITTHTLVQGTHTYTKEFELRFYRNHTNDPLESDLQYINHTNPIRPTNITITIGIYNTEVQDSCILTQNDNYTLSREKTYGDRMLHTVNAIVIPNRLNIVLLGLLMTELYILGYLVQKISETKL